MKNHIAAAAAFALATTITVQARSVEADTTRQ